MNKALFALIGIIGGVGAIRKPHGSAALADHKNRRRVAKQLAAGQATPEEISERIARPIGNYQGAKISPQEVYRISSDLVKTNDFYEDHGRFAKRGPAYFAFKKILTEEEPEVAVRTVDLILTMLPGFTHVAPGMWATEENIIEAGKETGLKGDGLKPWVNMMLQALEQRRLTRETIDPDASFNIDEASRRWPNIRFSPFITKAVKHVIQANPEHSELVEELEELSKHGQRSLSYVFDWAQARNIDLNNMSVDNAWDGAAAWHMGVEEQRNRAQAQARRALGKWFDCPEGVHPIKGEVVYEFPNGFSIQKMSTKLELQNEANLTQGYGCLRHCVGEFDSYFSRMKNRDMDIYSLRDSRNRPHVTIAIDLENRRPWSVNQLRGYLNRYAGNDGGGGKNTILGGRPLDPQFEGAEDYLDAEALMIGEFLKSIGLSKLDASQETSSIDRRIKRIQRQAEQRGAQNRRGTQTRGRK